MDNLSPEPQMKITHSLLCAQKPKKIFFNFLRKGNEERQEKFKEGLKDYTDYTIPDEENL